MTKSWVLLEGKGLCIKEIKRQPVKGLRVYIYIRV